MTDSWILFVQNYFVSVWLEVLRPFGWKHVEIFHFLGTNVLAYLSCVTGLIEVYYTGEIFNHLIILFV